ncbi:hypothetical protein M0R89_04340 [Halorussus limi]|uniref:Uncharacterized protein n=1 Tax=Halorussus limi TaxID=2938695 RepID=A0A8U0HW44_9EURY|nr:hypothetical protein [Halorussus limi]UPV75300.1 hypothetical protein M0R89_04340 [Halorussus limi]
MAIIELNLEKPALKRVESVEDEQMEGTQRQADVDPEEVANVMEVEAEPDQQSKSGGKSRVKKYGRRLAILGGTAAGAAAVRKLRQRRKSSGEQQELEEDWQTADSTSSSSGSQ